jgi:type IV pilus assembly protein PilC
MSKVSREGLIVLFLQLEQMEKAGVPLLAALTSARDDATLKPLKKDLDGMLAQVKTGAQLSEAMALYPRYFDEPLRQLVAIGEKSGRLAQVFGLALDYVRKRDEHIRLMKRATREPKISGAIIIGLALFRRHTAMPIMAGSVIGAYAAFWLLRRFVSPFRALTDMLVLHVPRLGRLVAQDSFARFAECLALLYAAGVELRQGLAIAAGAVPNQTLRRALEDALPSIRDGASLHEAFAKTGRMDNMALAMIRAGEDTGNLSATLKELADYYEKNTADALTAVQQLAAPVLTIIVGAMLYLGL